DDLIVRGLLGVLRFLPDDLEVLERLVVLVVRPLEGRGVLALESPDVAEQAGVLGVALPGRRRGLRRGPGRWGAGGGLVVPGRRRGVPGCLLPPRGGGLGPGGGRRRGLAGGRAGGGPGGGGGQGRGVAAGAVAGGAGTAGR